MEMLPGEIALNNAFNSWLEKYNFTVRVSGMGLDFCWDFLEDTIEYSILYTDQNQEEWNKFMVELGLEYEIDAFWTSFLHECFHSETWFLVDDEDMSVPDDISPYDYFRCPREYIASAAMVHFINENFEAVQELMDMVREPMEKFWEVNQIQI